MVVETQGDSPCVFDHDASEFDHFVSGLLDEAACLGLKNEGRKSHQIIGNNSDSSPHFIC